MKKQSPQLRRQKKPEPPANGMCHPPGIPAFHPQSISLSKRYFLSKIKQRQLITLRQISKQSEIGHQIDRRLADLGPLPEIIQ